jgi:ferritin-like metal-binding protein YciE
MQMNSLNDLMLQTLNDLHSIERRQLETLPMVMGAVDTPELRDALQQHQQETQQHVERLQEVFRILGQQPKDVPNPVLDAMVKRSQEVLQSQGDPMVKEAAIIAEAQKFEHMEMAGYGTACAYAKVLGKDEAAHRLHEILDEEKRSDERLSRIAQTSSNKKASKKRE